MIAAIAVVIITIFCIAQFYLRSTVLKSFITLFSALIAIISSFGFYEVLATNLISRGYGAQWAHGGCFILIFAIAFAITRILSDFLVGANIDFGPVVQYVTSIVAGTVTGLIISGAVVTSMAMMPIGSNKPYARFGETLEISQPKSPLLNVDGMVTSLFKWVSKGSLCSNKSFAMYHPNFLDQMHLSKRKAKDGVLTIAAPDAISIEEVRIRSTGPERTDVRIAFKASDIKDGGARDENGSIKFLLSQICLICLPSSATEGSTDGIKVIYPEDYKRPNEPWGNPIGTKKVDLDKVVQISPNDFSKQKKAAFLELSFNVPNNMKPKILQFKQSTVVKMPSVKAGGDPEETPKETPEEAPLKEE